MSILVGNCPSGELSVWGIVRVGNCPVGNCPSGELSEWGIVRVGNCPVGNCPSGELSSGELSVYPQHMLKLRLHRFVSFTYIVIWIT